MSLLRQPNIVKVGRMINCANDSLNKSLSPNADIHSSSRMASPESITEGSATIYVTNEKSTDVFYNPVQQFNRDMSVAVINQFAKDKKSESDDFKGLQILEALSATGLRSIRYANEIPGCTKIIANDFLARAVKAIDYNITANNVQDKVVSSHADAADLMCKHKKEENRFDVVDLDPYGAPTHFLDGAVQSVAEGGRFFFVIHEINYLCMTLFLHHIFSGLLCVTCTDMAVLCGNGSETCFTKYGSVSLRGKNCHEMALRIVLQCIESHANRYGRYIVSSSNLSFFS